MKIIVFICLMVVSSCTNLAFQPSRPLYFSPQKVLQITPDDLLIPVSDDVLLHAWRFHAKSGESKGVVIQFHGNAENISTHFFSVAWLLNDGYDVLTYDYRGYGLSGGIPNMADAVKDGEKVLSFVQDLYKDHPIPIILYGQSLGSVIAMNTVARTKIPVAEVIFEGGIYSLNQVSTHILSQHAITWLFQPLGYVLMSGKYNFKNIRKRFPKIPVLVLHSKQDPVIQYQQGQKIYNALPDPKCILLVDELTHVNIGNINNGKYRPEILDFLDHQTCPTLKP